MRQRDPPTHVHTTLNHFSISGANLSQFCLNKIERRISFLQNIFCCIFFNKNNQMDYNASLLWSPERQLLVGVRRYGLVCALGKASAERPPN